MPDITIIKLKIRRGTDAQRREIVLEQGELGYTTDTQRVFIGDGNTAGGTSIGTTIHSPTRTSNLRTSIVNAIKGDIVSDNSLLYQLTGTNYALSAQWAFIGPKVDNNTLEYSADNSLIVKDGGITSNKLASTSIGGGLSTGTSGLVINVDGSTLIVTATNKLSVNQIDQRHIATASLGNGIKGGSGEIISIKADNSLFGFNSGVLTLTAIPLGTVTTASLSTGSRGSSLKIVGEKLETSIRAVDSTLQLTSDTGTIGLKNIIDSQSTFFQNVSFNAKGQIVNLTPCITTVLSGSSTGSLSVFNGKLGQSAFTNQTLIPVISSNAAGTSSVTITLTSAGYIFLTTSNYGKIAIPVAKYFDS